MSKAILVLDKMPKRCDECSFCIKQKTNDFGSYGKCLVLTNKSVDCLMWKRDSDCPLKPAPEPSFIVDEKTGMKLLMGCDFDGGRNDVLRELGVI